MNYIELKSAIILGIVDTIVEDRAHIPETNYKRFSIAKSRGRDASFYSRRRLPAHKFLSPLVAYYDKQEKLEWLHLDHTFAMNLS